MNIRRPRRRRGRDPRYPDLITYFAKTHDTQAAVAAAVGATQGQISRILRGHTVPRPALALRLADHCRVPLDSFLTNYANDSSLSRSSAHDQPALAPPRR